MKQNLNFSWLFQPGFEASYLNKLPATAERVDLPHAAVKVPLNYFSEEDYQGLFTYALDFDLLDPTAPVHLLTFEGAMSKIHVYLNGRDYGEHISMYFPVTLDVTPSLKEKGNHLLVVLDSREDPQIPPFGRAVDYLTFSGLYRGVHLDSHKASYLSRLYIRGDADGTLQVVPSFGGAKTSAKPHYIVYDGKEAVLEFDEETAHLNNPHLYSPEDPHLYTLLTLLGEEKRTDVFGFRDAVFTDRGFFLNGKRFELIGLNRHQNYPYVGPALPASAQIDDAQILKNELGCNVVRTSHYADDESFLDECDRLGLLLIDEVPGWQYVGQDAAWRDHYYDFLKRLVYKESNHPCLIAYGVRIDESGDDHDLYARAEEIVRGLDPKRATLGVRNFKGSECLEDVYAYNDFSCSGLSHGLDDPHSYKAPKGKGLLVTEHNGHMFPTKAFDNSARRLEQALRHARVIDDAISYPSLSGVIGWCAFDYNTHRDFGAGDHICYHGVSDIFRLPKTAAYLYASQSQENVFYLSSNLDVGESDECLFGDVYVFTDADYVELRKNGVFIARFYPDKKDFPHLPHPPVFIDDFIGDSFREPAIKPGDYKGIVAALNDAARHGLSRLALKNKLFMASCLVKYHLSFDDLTRLYSKYISSWGEKAPVYEFSGYKDGKRVALKEAGPSTSFHLSVASTKKELTNDETYDVARVSIRKLDQHGSKMNYAEDIVSLSAEGPIAIIGPQIVSLVGGGISVYVRSLLTKGKATAKLLIRSGSEQIEVPFSVR